VLGAPICVCPIKVPASAIPREAKATKAFPPVFAFKRHLTTEPHEQHKCHKGRCV
jgi:hypothetical protein